MIFAADIVEINVYFPVICKQYLCRHKQIISMKGFEYMKATGIVRRIDDLGRIVIPKEIRRTMRIREGDPSLNTLLQSEALALSLAETAGGAGSEDV